LSRACVGKVGTLKTDYCELHNGRPNFALFPLFSGAIMQIAPAQSNFQWETGRLLCNLQDAWRTVQVLSHR
jgi:hypothetical protein